VSTYRNLNLVASILSCHCTSDLLKWWQSGWTLAREQRAMPSGAAAEPSSCIASCSGCDDFQIIVRGDR